MYEGNPKLKVDELVKQTGVLHQLREPKGEGTSPRHYGTRGKKKLGFGRVKIVTDE